MIKYFTLQYPFLLLVLKKLLLKQLKLKFQKCPYCSNKSEKKLLEYLDVTYNVKTQFKQDWCKNDATNKLLPYDFLLTDYKLIIELDGPQHFKKISNWQDFKDTQDRDIYKMKCANENKYSIIRIIQYDVWNDKNDWKNKLEQAIHKIIADKIVQNIFICNNNEYDNYV
jgi:very-short-patch-repair endonuclease